MAISLFWAASNFPFRHLCPYDAQGSLDNVLVELYKILKSARLLGDFLLVGIHSDQIVRQVLERVVLISMTSTSGLEKIQVRYSALNPSSGVKREALKRKEELLDTIFGEPEATVATVMFCVTVATLHQFWSRESCATVATVPLLTQSRLCMSDMHFLHF